MKRGEVWWAELAGDAGFRPVAAVSHVIRSLPCEVPVSSSERMPSACVINPYNLHTIPKDRLRRRIAELPAEKRFALDQALRHSLDLEL